MILEHEMFCQEHLKKNQSFPQMLWLMFTRISPWTTFKGDSCTYKSHVRFKVMYCLSKTITQVRCTKNLKIRCFLFRKRYEGETMFWCNLSFILVPYHTKSNIINLAHTYLLFRRFNHSVSWFNEATCWSQFTLSWGHSEDRALTQTKTLGVGGRGVKTIYLK